MARYRPKVYRQAGSDRLVVASGGSADVESGGEMDIESGGQFKVGGAVAISTGGRVGPGFAYYIEQATSSFATLVGYGISHVRAATAVTLPLAAPTAGVEKWIAIATTAATVTITSSSAGADFTTGGSTQISITTGTITAPSWAHLVGQNSTRWMVLGLSANVTIS